jgi:hypothetical protein
MVIELEKYLKELSSITSFYRYLEVAFQDSSFLADIQQHEFAVTFETAQEYVSGGLDASGKASSLFKELVEQSVNESISSGLMIVRRQILEFCHSILEKYLSHIVRVYLHTFPEILMDIDKKVSFRDIASLEVDPSVKTKNGLC